jgi:hypothetical protein
MGEINHFNSNGHQGKEVALRAASAHCLPPRLFGKAAAFLSWLFLILAGAGCLLAGELCQVAGKVTEGGQGPLSGAVVALSAADGSRQIVSTDQKERYSFLMVKAGTYTLSVEAAAYQGITRTGVVVAAGTPSGVDLQLVPKALPSPGPKHPNGSRPFFVTRPS